MQEDIPVMEPDQEWHVRHNPMRRRRMQARPFVGVVVVLLIVFMVGMAGGLVGFVALTNSDSYIARLARNTLRLNEDSTLRVPVRQDIKLEESSAIIDAVKKVSPAVVSITASENVTNYFGITSKQDVSSGSGFIITSDGLIVTNKHVVTDQAATYRVLLNDGRELTAEVKARDTLNDLAILKVDAKDLPTVELGSSDALQVGQNVIAIGNALGEFENSVTSGVVSAMGRSLDGVGAESESLSDLIQTDASINQGNSGGPLVNLAGQVVGINTAIASTNGGSVGIGFAISIDSIRSILDSVRKTGEIIRPYLGVRSLAITPLVKKQNNLTVDYGALVSRNISDPTLLAVIPGSPADKAGIRENDIILEINGKKVEGVNGLPKLLQSFAVGQQVSIKIQRGGAEQTLQATLEKMPDTLK